MGIILGIDVGGSTTKIVGLERNALDGKKDLSGKRVGALQVRAADQRTSMYGAIGNFLSTHGFGIGDVSTIYLTGVGASFISEQIYGIETQRVSEFNAIGRGALCLTGLDEALVVSMGTGTAFVRAGKNEMLHLGGSGVGGGTVLGLASQMLGKSNIDAILALAEKGDLRCIDLSVRDILGTEVRSLPHDLTAANFGKVKSTATDCDIALGIINMVFETIGMLAVFALRSDTTKDVVLTGTLASSPQAKTVFSKFNQLTGVNFIIHEDAIFATALGAIE